ncbi:hypothetical protein BKP35_04850 [Anaerobacillus arseniciselenatis]|uniref:Uncharacterized protein n=1 Tax=Anaerobacillus arseniciselenatis TaxID=85682 RepID=A0A1S2LRP6_9BACI|nr:hypothetical protein [Anaerobacillus arseniciselenatis]OIJ15182.1 hypothetical protein BKP35_04850 [Anaerobacillus arseniciselenatis]
MKKVFKAFKTKEWPSSTAYGFDPTWLIIAAAAAANFQSAEQTVGTSGSTGGFTGGGAGT